MLFAAPLDETTRGERNIKHENCSRERGHHQTVRLPKPSQQVPRLPPPPPQPLELPALTFTPSARNETHTRMTAGTSYPMPRLRKLPDATKTNDSVVSCGESSLPARRMLPLLEVVVCLGRRDTFSTVLPLRFAAKTFPVRSPPLPLREESPH